MCLSSRLMERTILGRAQRLLQCQIVCCRGRQGRVSCLPRGAGVCLVRKPACASTGCHPWLGATRRRRWVKQPGGYCKSGCKNTSCWRPCRLAWHRKDRTAGPTIMIHRSSFGRISNCIPPQLYSVLEYLFLGYLPETCGLECLELLKQLYKLRQCGVAVLIE